jgi:hypothetical protein
MERILDYLHQVNNVEQEHEKSASHAAAAAATAPSIVDFDETFEPDLSTTDDNLSLMKLHTAISEMDATAVSALLQTGLQMDEVTTDAAFWEVVRAVDRAEKLDQPLSADVPRMLHHIFDADLRHLQSREKISTNVTCMQPDESHGLEGAARRMNYIFDDSAHKDLPLTEGRRCEGGSCCDKCSRNIFPTFATEPECSLETFPELASLTFNDLEKVSSATILQFVRLVERVRRTMAYEYGLPLRSILPLQVGTLIDVDGLYIAFIKPN